VSHEGCELLFVIGWIGPVVMSIVRFSVMFLGVNVVFCLVFCRGKMCGSVGILHDDRAHAPVSWGCLRQHHGCFVTPIFGLLFMALISLF